MTTQDRLNKLEKARTAAEIERLAALDAFISSLTLEELETLARGTADDIRSGRLSGPDLVEYCRLSDTPDLDAWLETIPPLQPGDTELVKKILAAAPK